MLLPYAFELTTTAFAGIIGARVPSVTVNAVFVSTRISSHKPCIRNVRSVSAPPSTISDCMF